MLKERVQNADAVYLSYRRLWESLVAARAALESGDTQAAQRDVERGWTVLLEDSPIVKISDASRILKVSSKTVSAWANRGLLTEAEGERPRKVTLESVVRVEAMLDELRLTERRPRLLHHLADRALLERSDVRSALADAAADETVQMPDLS